MKRIFEPGEHQEIHKNLHEKLDELVSDFIMHTKNLPSQTTLIELMGWSHKQTINPAEETNERMARFYKRKKRIYGKLINP